MKSYEYRYLPILIIIAILGIAAFSGCSSAPQVEEDTVSNAQFVNTYNKALTEPLEKATSEINDPDLAQFSQKLVSAYGLGNIPEDEENLANMVPDIEGITRTATDLPLIEAGKNIQDEEIAEFYSSFIESIGVKNHE